MICKSLCVKTDERDASATLLVGNVTHALEEGDQLSHMTSCNVGFFTAPSRLTVQENSGQHG